MSFCLKVPMLEPIQEEAETEKTIVSQLEMKKVGDKDSPDDQKMLSTGTNTNKKVGNDNVDELKIERENAENNQVVENKSTDTKTISKVNQDNHARGESDDKGKSSSKENREQQSHFCTDLHCSKMDKEQKGSQSSHHRVSFAENNIEINPSTREEAVDENRTHTNLWNKIKMAFSWNDFFYSIIFGLLPTSWDVLSDLRFGWSLSKSGDNSSAGLCYLFVMIPGLFFLQDVLHKYVINKRCSSRVNTMLYCLYGAASTSALVFGFWWEPLTFRYPATVIGCAVIGVKVVGVFVHIPEMKAFSVRVSAFEYTTESNLQLSLLFYIWSVLTNKLGYLCIFYEVKCTLKRV